LAVRISFYRKIIVLIRGFFIQSFWNYHNLQSVGLFYMLEGLDKHSLPEKDNKVEHYRNNLCFYNGHPYFCGIPAGVLAGSRLSGNAMDQSQVTRFKEAITSPLGAIGDVIFWSHLRPLFLLLPFLWAPFVAMDFIVIFLALMMVLYATTNIASRWWGFEEGLRLGLSVFKDFNMRRFEKRVRVLRIVLVGLVFYLMGMILVKTGLTNPSLSLTFFGNIVIIFLIRKYLKNPYLMMLTGLFLIWLVGRFILV
jgi:mannose/fructose/N-acetylgalactosamine-specific phosphotransferase system component IID